MRPVPTGFQAQGFGEAHQWSTAGGVSPWSTCARPLCRGEQLEGVAVREPHDREVAAIERGNCVRAFTLRNRDHARVDLIERKVTVRRAETGDAPVIGGLEIEYVELTCGDAVEEAQVPFLPVAPDQEKGDLGDDRSRHGQVAGEPSEQLRARLVIAVARVEGSEDRAAVADQH